MTIFINQNILLPFSNFIKKCFFFHGAFLVLDHGGFTITLRDTTLSKSPLESDQPDAQASLPDNTQHLKKQTSMPPTGFEPPILASESRRPTP
jgi:hypothetical protein